MEDNRNILGSLGDLLNDFVGAITPEAAFVNFSKEDIRIFFDFAQQLTAYDKSEKMPDTISQNMIYYLKMQQKRLEKRGLRIKYNYEPTLTESEYIKKQKALLALGNRGLGMIGKKYSCLNFDIPFEKQLNIFREQDCIFKEKKNDVILHQTAVKLNDAKMEDQIEYSCPNCGAVSKISTLINGCPYCGSHFVMTDLFPKITDFHFTIDIEAFPELSGRKKKGFFSYWFGKIEGKSEAQLLLPPIVIGAVAGILVMLAKGNPADFTVYGAAMMGIYGAFCAVIIGIILLALLCILYIPFGLLRFLGNSIINRKKDNPHKSFTKELKDNTAYKKLYQFMKGYYPNFSVEYFRNKMVSYLKMILVSDDIDNLAFYHGDKNIQPFDQIVEAEFSGYIDLIHSSVDGKYCYLTLDFYMADLWDKDGKIKRQADVFRMSVCKDLSVEEDPESSLSIVECPHCGGSFDAMKEKCCPYCDSEYDLLQSDWVVTKVEQI